MARELEMQFQSSFPDKFWEGIEDRNLELGLNTSELLCKIVDDNPRIQSFQYFSYNMMVDSEGELKALNLQELPAHDLSRDRLEKLSKKIYRLVPAEKSTNGMAEVYGLGISSRVLLKDGSKAHIPMLDFMSRKHYANFNVDVVQELLKPFPGDILETGNSYHYLGRKLLTEHEWRSFLHNTHGVFGKRLQDLCEGFFDYSLKRGFSGLRIFAYPPYKKVEPYVVAII